VKIFYSEEVHLINPPSKSIATALLELFGGTWPVRLPQNRTARQHRRPRQILPSNSWTCSSIATRGIVHSFEQTNLPLLHRRIESMADPDPPEPATLESLQALHADLLALSESRLLNIERLGNQLDAHIKDFRALLDKKPRSDQSRQTLGAGT
jgi:hypothetical protein